MCLRKYELSEKSFGEELASAEQSLQTGNVDEVRDIAPKVAMWRQAMRPGLPVKQQCLAHLPITAGGLGLPDLQALALAARTAALAIIPNEAQLAAYKEELIEREGPRLLDQLQARLAHPIAELVGDLRHMPVGKSTRQLSRKLMHSIHQHSVRTLRRTE